jgi:mRNA-degrading endonuclease YafQ of YafQ-DinJ toxin-antitoxin module
MNSRNADLNMIMINVNALQKDYKVKLKNLYNDKQKINNIIDLLIKTSTLEKKKNKDYS